MQISPLWQGTSSACWKSGEQTQSVCAPVRGQGEVVAVGQLRRSGRGERRRQAASGSQVLLRSPTGRNSGGTSAPPQVKRSWEEGGERPQTPLP